MSTNEPKNRNLNQSGSKFQGPKNSKVGKDSPAQKGEDFGFQTHFYRPPEYKLESEEELYEQAVEKHGRVAQMHWELFI